ncbi:HNH endonuclease [Anatilimnocola floriformis]|uniref:HNH endonuclease n=1 Tax=Anatilimnocola floriformis TaxID=2948575 RepID=UPI0036F1FA4D
MPIAAKPLRTQPRHESRLSSYRRGYDHHWRAARIQFLRQHPLCVECQSVGIATAATVVDHVTPHRGCYALFWNQSNWQSLCERCHNVKTAHGG